MLFVLPVPFDIFAVASEVNNNGQSVQEVKILRFSRLLRVVKLGWSSSYFSVKLIENEPSIFSLPFTDLTFNRSCVCGGGAGDFLHMYHDSVARVVKAMRIVKRWEEELSISHSLAALLKNITGTNKQTNKHTNNQTNK